MLQKSRIYGDLGSIVSGFTVQWQKLKLIKGVMTFEFFVGAEYKVHIAVFTSSVIRKPCLKNSIIPRPVI